MYSWCVLYLNLSIFILNVSQIIIGPETNSEEDESVIQGWINYLEETFDLVMITDYFDESMVLMKVK